MKSRRSLFWWLRRHSVTIVNQLASTEHTTHLGMAAFMCRPSRTLPSASWNGGEESHCSKHWQPAVRPLNILCWNGGRNRRHSSPQPATAIIPPKVAMIHGRLAGVTECIGLAGCAARIVMSNIVESVNCFGVWRGYSLSEIWSSSLFGSYFSLLDASRSIRSIDMLKACASSVHGE